jgi:hypothetical protein
MTQTLSPERQTGENAPDTKDSTWIGIFGAWLKKQTFERIRAQVQKAKEKLLRVNKNFEAANLGEVVTKLDDSKKELQNLEKEMQRVEAQSEVKVVQKKIEEVNKVIKRLEREIKEAREVAGSDRKKEQKDEQERKLCSLMLRELYRDDHALLSDNKTDILPSGLKGLKAELIAQVSKQQDPSKAFTRKENEELFAGLEKYQRELAAFRKKQGYGERTQVTAETGQAPSKAEQEKQSTKLDARLKKEKERYRRSADIEALSTKLETGYLSPNEQKRYVRLLESHIDDLVRTKDDPNKTYEDGVFVDLAKDIDLEQVRAQMAEFKKTQSTGDEETSQLEKDLQDQTNIKERQKIIRKHQAKLLLASKSFGNPEIAKAAIARIGSEYLEQAAIDKIYSEFETNQKQNQAIQKALEVEQKTGFKAQIQERIKKEIPDPENLLKGAEELSKARMRELEREKRLEKEGPIEQRIEMARAFARDRIMEEYDDVGRIENLYGTHASHAFNYVRAPAEFAKDMMQEIEERFNIGPDGRINPESFEWDTDAQKKNELDNATLEKHNRLAKEAFEKIQKEIQAVAQRDTQSRELMSKLEESDKREQFEAKVKQDIRLAKLKSELTKLGKSPQDIESIMQKPAVQGALAEVPPDWDTIKQNCALTDTQNLDSLNTVEEKLDFLFGKNENQTNKVHNYTTLSTPNGLAIVFNNETVSDTNGKTRDEIFKELITGAQDGLKGPETLAVTLKNNDSLKEFAKTNGQENWDGALMLISSDSSPLQLAHEVQHAILKEMKNTQDRERLGQSRILEDAVEELAIKLSTGEISRDIVYQKISELNPQDKQRRLSLASISYITPEMIGEGAGQISKENAQKLQQILEYAKLIAAKEIEIAEENAGDLTKLQEDAYSSVIADILMSSRNESGNIDLDQALEEIKHTFRDLEDKGINVPAPLNISSNDYKLLCFGDKDGNPDIEDYLKNRLLDTGFTYDIGLIDLDYRGTPNKIHDYIHQNPKGGGFVGFEKEVNPMLAIYSTTLGKVPILGPLTQSLLENKLGEDEGPTEYHVDGGIFGENSPLSLSYKWQRRAIGGVLKKFGIVNEKGGKFGVKFVKLFNYLPPFGRGWEPIVKGALPLIPGANWLKEKYEEAFPGRTETKDYVEMNQKLPQERWTDQIQQIGGVLGPNGLGYGNQEVQRIMGEIPGIKYMFEGGRLVFDVSLLDMDELASDGKHRGRIKTEMVKALEEESDLAMDKDCSEEVGSLASLMADAYDKDDFAITMRDVIKKANISHDLGINPEIADSLAKYHERGGVRNLEYLTANNKDDKFVQEGDLMVSQHVWYNKEDPNIRGIIINGQKFSLKAANELIYRYNSYHVKQALKNGLPEITPEMQQTEAEIDFSKTVEFKPGEVVFKMDPATGHLVEVPGTRTNKATCCRVILEDDKGVRKQTNEFRYYNPDGTENQNLVHGKTIDGKPILYATDPKKRNKYYSPGMMATGVPGIPPDASGNRIKQVLWLTKANQGDLWGRYGKAVGFYTKFMQTFKEISRYERRAYFVKTFFADTKEWIQKLGNVAMVGSLLGAAFTGAPVFAGIFLATMAFRIPAVWWMQREEKIYGARRIAALGFLSELRGKAGIYEGLIKDPSSLTRFQESALHTLYEENNARMEDTAKEGVPKGSAPSNDMAFKMFGGIFGGEGFVAKTLAG